MVKVMRDGTTYQVTKAYQNGVEYNLNGYIIGGPMSGITITSDTPFVTAYSGDDGYLRSGASYVNGNKLQGIITGTVRNRRSSSTDTCYWELQIVSKELSQNQDFVFFQTEGTHNPIGTWYGRERWFTNGTYLKVLGCYYNHDWNNGYSDYNYDEWTIELDILRISHGTGTIHTLGTFADADVSEFGLDGYSDVQGINPSTAGSIGIIPGYTNGWFTNLAINADFYPYFKLA